jgi:hypothetical protein
MTPRQAVEFFATKIEQQARSEDVHLTQSEKLMLRFSEVEPDGIKDAALAAQFEDDEKTNDHEEKMGQLLVRAYEQERDHPELRQKWTEAKDALKNHDYYIWVMAWNVFPETMPELPRGKPSKAIDYLIYIAVGLTVVAALVYFSLTSG